MMQKIKELPGVQKIVLLLLLFAGVLFVVNSQPYRAECVEEFNDWGIGFLQKGTYTVEVTYEAVPVGSSVRVYSPDMPDSAGSMGVVYADRMLAEGSGVVRIPFTLTEGAYDLRIGLADGQEGYLTKLVLQSNHLIHKDNYFVGALLCLAAVVLLVCFVRLPAEKYMVPLILVLLGVVASIPLFSESLLQGDDIDFHLARLEGLYLGLAVGEFPVRITPQQMSGYGSLTATMYPQLFLYPIACLRFLGISLMGCYKFLCIVINVGTAFAAYYSARAILKSHRTALFVSVLYTFAVYRLSNLYVRAALGETLAMVFMPIVLWGVYEILWGRRRWLILVLGMTGVLGSHVLSVELGAFFMVMELVFWFFSKKKNQFAGRFLDGIKAVVVTLLLNAFFLVPFLYYCGEPLQCFMLPFGDLSDSVAYFSQMFALFPPVTGINAVAGSTEGEFAIAVGAVLLLGMAAFLYVYRRREEEDARRNAGMHCFFYGVVALIMASWIFPWERLSGVAFFETIFGSLQFTWRFLSPGTLFLCVVAAVAFDKLCEKAEGKWTLVVAATLVVVSAWSMFDALAAEREQHTDRMGLEGFCAADGMYMYPVSDVFYPAQVLFDRSECGPVACYSTDIVFENYQRRGTHIYMEVTPEPGVQEDILFPLYYYPGYVVTVNGEEVPSFERNHLLCAEAPGEEAVVEAYYKGFWFFGVADAVTLLTFLGIVGTKIYKSTAGKSRAHVKVKNGKR